MSDDLQKMKDNSANILVLGMPLGLPLGVAVGISLGLALDSIAVGLAMGIGIGMSFSVAIGAARLAEIKKKQDAAADGDASDEEKS